MNIELNVSASLIEMYLDLSQKITYFHDGSWGECSTLKYYSVVKELNVSASLTEMYLGFSLMTYFHDGSWGKGSRVYYYSSEWSVLV